MNDSNVVVDIRKLWTVFKSADGEVVVHRDLELRIERGEVLSPVSYTHLTLPTILRV